MEECIICGEELFCVDDDPNGDKNCKCCRCVAEEDHDYDLEPEAIFDRYGNRVD